MLSPAILRRRMSFAPGPAFYAFGATNPLFVRDYERQRYLDGASVVSSGSALSVTRASNGTLINSSGILETLGNNAARFDWTTGRRALLNEATATNLATNSTASIANWVNNTASLTARTDNALGVFPGVAVASTGAIFHRLGVPSIVYATGTTYTATFFYSGGTSGRSKTVLFQTGAGDLQVSGVIGSLAKVVEINGTIISVANVSYPNNIWAVQVTFQVTLATTATHGVGPDTATAGQDVIVYGGQIEVGAAATSYIATSGGSATRAAETVTIPSLALATYDIRIIRTTGTTDLKLVVHPGGAYTVPNGAPVHQVLVYPGGTLP